MLASCILNPWTSSPDCCASWVDTASFTQSSSCIQTATGCLPASSCLFVKVCIQCSILVWSHLGWRKVCVIRVVISTGNEVICARWSHALCTVLMCSVYSVEILIARSLYILKYRYIHGLIYAVVGVCRSMSCKHACALSWYLQLSGISSWVWNDHHLREIMHQPNWSHMTGDKPYMQYSPLLLRSVEQENKQIDNGANKL